MGIVTEIVDNAEVIGVDADETLWPTSHLYTAAINKVAAAATQSQSRQEELRKAILNQHQVNTNTYGFGALSLLKTFTDVIDRQVSAPFAQHAITAAASAVQEIHNDPPVLFPGVIDTIEELKRRGKRVIVITKGSVAEQEAKLLQSGLLVERIVVLSSKHAHAYCQVSAEHGFQLEEFLMIGDSLRNDVLPVLSAGGQAVWLRSENWEDQPPLGALPAEVLVIDSLPELLN